MIATIEDAYVALHQAVQQAAQHFIDNPDVRLENPRDKGHGDIATNAALILAGRVKQSPRVIAESMVAAMSLPDGLVSEMSVAGPGFINFTFSTEFLHLGLRGLLLSGAAFGKHGDGAGKRAQVEFVSANPTGPLTIGHGRQAILGDAVARILENASYDVHREYYFNDAGRQMRLLGESIHAHYIVLTGGTASVPEGGYQGAYIEELARDFLSHRGDGYADSKVDEFIRFGREALFVRIKETLQRLGIRFDEYYSEQSLYDSGKIGQIIDLLRKRELVYEKDDALWLDGGMLDLDQDWVMVRGTGEPTYRLPDIAYHVDKLNRNFDLIVDVFGADHQATYPVVLAAVQALGLNISPIHVLIHQFVTVKRGGREVRMSKRTGDYLTLDELVQEVGSDAVRFFYLLRVRNSHLSFDIDLALKETDENPVFYVQYAHARTAGILRHAREYDLPEMKDTYFERLCEEEELALIRQLLRFPGVTRQALETLEPQKITGYLREVAAAFHQFYQHHRVISDDLICSRARLALVEASRIVLKRGLELLGISAPDKM